MVDGRLDIDRAAEVMDGYQGRLSIESGERESLQFFAIYAGTAISAWHYVHTHAGKPPGSRSDKYKYAAARTEQLFNLAPSVFYMLLN